MAGKGASASLAGFNARRRSVADRLAAYAAENAKRRPCKQCGNLVLPAKMDQHVRAYHDR